jgi:SnoaL-like polyketide cyclase
MTRQIDFAILSPPATLELTVHSAPGGAMAASVNEAAIRRAIEAIWNCGDLDVADDLFDPRYVNHYGLISDLVLRPEAIKISAALHRLAFPHLCVVVEQLSTEKGIVVVGWTAKVTGGGRDSGDVESNQQSVKGITRNRFMDGKIVESWSEWDQTGVLRDLGSARTD